MDTVDILAGLQKITGITKTTKEKQNRLNVSDVWHLWDLLVVKYDYIEVVNIYLNFAKDKDLKFVTRSALKHFEIGAAEVEQLMTEYAIPLPQRPPHAANSTINLEIITDKYIFNNTHNLLKQILPILTTAFNNSRSPITIKFFKKHLITTLELVDNMSMFGQMKSYINPIPMYMP